MSNTPRPIHGNVVMSSTIRWGGEGPAGPKPLSFVGRRNIILRKCELDARAFVEEMRRQREFARLRADAEAKGLDPALLAKVEALCPGAKKRGKKAFRRRFR